MGEKGWDTARLFSSARFRVVAQDGAIRSIYYPGETYLGSPTEVFAYLGLPETRGGDLGDLLPGIVLVHGGGGTAFKQWVEMWVARGYAAIAMDLSGRGPDGQRLPNAGPEQDHPSIFNTQAGWKDLWTYHAIAAVIRANNILRGLETVDLGRIGVTGISWGGYLTCIAAGVDPRFACAIPVYGCGFIHLGSADDWMQIFTEMTPDQRQKWVSRCDPSVYLPDAFMPMLFVSGTNDFAYPLDILQLSSRLPRGPVSFCVRHEMAHSHEDGWAPAEIGLFADQYLRAGQPLARLGSPQRAGFKVRAEVRDGLGLRAGFLLYTCEGGRWQERKWEVAPAVLKGASVTAELPVGTKAYFLACEDERGAYASSPYEEIPAGG